MEQQVGVTVARARKSAAHLLQTVVAQNRGCDVALFGD
jgi:hypothetical protein